MEQKAQVITQASAAQAFADWETDYRANPETFYTAEEVAAQEVASLSEARAIHFMALLRQRDVAAALPAIGLHLPAHGGTYIGIASDIIGGTTGHLVLLDSAPAKKLNWLAAKEWAASLGDGARLPTRTEALQIFANARGLLKPKWHWTCEEDDASYAWFCYFLHGSQLNTSKSFEGSAVAVRRLTLQSFNSLDGGAA